MERRVAILCALLPMCALAVDGTAEVRAELGSGEPEVETPTTPLLLREPALGTTSHGMPDPGKPVRTAFALSPPVLPPTAPPAASPASRPPNALVPALEVAGMTAVMMSWNATVGEARWANVGVDTAWRNVRHWTFDDDQLFVNMLGHPYQGTWTFAAARSAGVDYWWSIPYTFAQSFVWEVAGETQPAAVNDQVTTVMAGAVLGEILHRLSVDLAGNGRDGWRVAGAALLSPLSVTNRYLLGRAPAEAPAPSTYELTVGATTAAMPRHPSGSEAGSVTSARAGATVVHGVTWSDAVEPERPFDHYRLELAYGALKDPQLTIFARGLVAGASFEALDRVRGLYGVFAGFDMDTPGAIRVATTSIGFGVTGGAVLTSELALDGTAIVSVVPMGGAGFLPHGKDVRDYRLGPGAQSLVEVGLTAWDRAALRLGARSYLVFGVDRPGEDWVTYGTATGIVQVAPLHGIGVELAAAGRVARDDGAGRWTQSGTWWQAFYRLGRLGAPKGSVVSPDASSGGLGGGAPAEAGASALRGRAD